MPDLWYIRYLDTAKEPIGQLWFYTSFPEATIKREEILHEIEKRGGPQVSDLYYDGEINWINYSKRSDLVISLNELNI